MPIPLTTTTQLLESLRSREDSAAWRMLVDRYEPVLIGVARRLGLGEADAADAAQQTLLDMVRELRAGSFDRRLGGLRRWTLGILRHRVGDIRRARPCADDRALDAGTTVDARGGVEADLDAVWETEFNRHLVATALYRLRSSTQLAANTLLAFELTVVRDVPIAAAAIECCMTTDEVYVARNRVSKRLRGIMEEVRSAFLDDES